MFKHVMWDFDGTLFNTYPIMGQIFQDLLKEKGIDEPLEEILKQMKISMSTAVNHYKEKYPIDEIFIEDYHNKRTAREIELSEPFEGMERICRSISDSGGSNYLYTHRGESAIALLKKYGLSRYFSDYITKEDGFERKPSPDAIQHLVKKHNMEKDETIMIGDRELDLLSAKNAGIHSCYFAERDKESRYADFTVHDVKQLFSIIGVKFE
ncbi:HAD-IA family hydrolase [Halobacillus litoralis]|uniref:HAD-IA family hydrolase n=1 Tax=Halobacillus litoralis TaxID=45668 RepID=UPI001CFEBCF0|nr:HAD-IA family hydrolase [Halobacillus litoralis]